ncbi:hypothetical protein ACLB2K_005336 [Fragaria x ananassa]
MPSGELRQSDCSEDEAEQWLWAQIKAEAKSDAESEPALASYIGRCSEYSLHTTEWFTILRVHIYVTG